MYRVAHYPSDRGTDLGVPSLDKYLKPLAVATKVPKSVGPHCPGAEAALTPDDRPRLSRHLELKI